MIDVARLPEDPPPELRFRRRLTLRSALVELWRSRELIRALVERELRARYKQTFLGVGWAVIIPLIYMVVLTVLFQKVVNVKTGGVPYALFSYVGLLPWTFFSGSVSTGGTSLLSNLSLLNKIYCPREVFPIASMSVAAIDSAVATTMLGPLFAINTFAPKGTAVWIPLLLLVQIAFTLGSTLAVASLVVYLRDLRNAVPVLLQLGLFATPVAYPLDAVGGSVRWIYALLNPLAPVIDGYRRVLLVGRPPDWPLLALGAITATLVLFGGYALFKRLETGIADVA